MVTAWLAAALLTPTADMPVSADLVVLNAKIWTANPEAPQAEAMAIWQGRILAIGTAEQVKPFIGQNTKTLDAQSHRVVPGFFDSHLHFLGGGLQLARVDLKNCETEEEFAKRLKEFDENTPRDRWLLGGNWDHERTFSGKLPTAALLDKYIKNRPVFLRRYDGHMALANSAAMNIAGISASLADPPGGVIGRLEDGTTPSGILKDNAMDLVEKFVPEATTEEIREAIQAAMKACAEQGITSVQDMEGSDPATRRLYFRSLQKLEKAKQLTVRIDVRWPIAFQNELKTLGIEAGFGSDYLRVGGLKGYMDGSLGSSTAKMHKPYIGEGENTGVFVTEPADMLAMVKSADAAGLAVAVHAIGDEANTRLLDLYEATAKANGERDRRFRIEHAQHLLPKDIARFGKQKVIASMQPFHVSDDGRWAENRVGKERCASSYAFRSLLDSGAVIAFGSDWPVAELAVFQGINSAVNRTTLDGKYPNGWFPEQAITIEEALTAYTSASAFAAGVDKQRGRLVLGADADFVFLEADPLAKPLTKPLGENRVNTTVVGGKVVYQREQAKR